MVTCCSEALLDGDCNQLPVCAPSSQQSLHRKKVDHATHQLLLNLTHEEKCLRSGHELLRKFCCREKNARLSSLCPACPCFPPSSLRYDMFSGEMHLSFPLSIPFPNPPFFFLINVLSTVCRYPLSPSSYPSLICISFSKNE